MYREVSNSHQKKDQMKKRMDTFQICIKQYQGKTIENAYVSVQRVSVSNMGEALILVTD